MDTGMLATAARALTDAGFAPLPAEAGDSSLRVRLTGENVHALVDVDDVMPSPRPPAAWTRAYGPGPEVRRGYLVAFREHRHQLGECSVHTEHVITAAEVVSTVRSWDRWEQTWSYAPPREPERRRLAYLRRLAASKLDNAVPLTVDIDPLMLGMLDAAQVETLHEALDDLHPPAVLWRFPRDRTGARLATRARVLLHECAPPRHQSQKGVHLVADGPVPRTEPTVTVRLAQAAGRSAVHRWESIPEYWRSGPRSLEDLWGATPDRAAEITDLLTAGRFHTALQRCGVTVDRSASRILSGLPESFENREWTDRWVTAATALLTAAAPWRWRDAIPPGRRRRIGNLGGPSMDGRAAFLLHRVGDDAALTFGHSGTPLVVPRAGWERDPDLDLLRLGLIDRDRIPLRA